MTNMRIFIFISFLISYCNSCFTEKENNFISALSGELLITHIVVINQTCQILNKISQLKHYSLNNIYTAYMNFSELLTYFNSGKPSDKNTMIVFKILSVEELKSLSKQFSNQITQKMSVSSGYKWMLLMPQNNEIVVTEKNFYIPIDCQYFLARETRNGYKMFQIYQIKRGTNMIYTNFGIWDQSYGLKITSTDFYREREDMKGTPFTISTLLGVPCRFNLECFHWELIHDFSVISNFTKMLVDVSEEELNKLKPDISGKISIWTYFNPKTDHLIGPLAKAPWRFYIRHQIDESYHWTSYFKPFSQNLWFTIIIWLIIASFIKAVIGKVVSTSLITNYTLLEQGLIPLTIICNQGVTYGPKTISSRIARFSAHLFCGIIVPAYSAAVISSLTVNIPKIPFTGFDSFIQDGTYKLASLLHPIIIAFFKESENSFMKVIREKYLLPYEDFCKSNQECAELVCNKRIAVATFNYKTLQLASPCRISEIPETLCTFYSATELGNETNTRRFFMELLIRFRSAGIFQRQHKNEYGHNEIFTEERYHSIDVNVISFILVVLLVGIVLSLCVLISEISWWKHQRHQHHQLSLGEGDESGIGSFENGSRKGSKSTKCINMHTACLED